MSQLNLFAAPTSTIAPDPLKLAEMALETVEPALVVDPYAGSGTVAVAAKKLGINYVCNDQSAEYVTKASYRVDSISFTPKLLDTYVAETIPMFAL